MSQPVQEAHLVLVESGVNSNKFYRLTLFDDGSVKKNWGRVGAAGQTKLEQGGRTNFERTLAQKKAKGYSEVQVVSSTPARTTVDNTALRETAAASLAGGTDDPILIDLVDRLVAANKHSLMASTGGMISVNLSGQVTTPLGVIDTPAIRQARALLSQMADMPADVVRAKLTEQYLRLVPQKVPVQAGRGWAQVWLDKLTSPAQQSALLDSLEASVSYAAAAKRSAEDESGRKVDEDFFRYRIEALDSGSDEYRQVVARYDQTVQTDVHAWSRTRAPKNVYRLTDRRHADDVEVTHKRVRNVRRLWHGTGAANVLSILQKGLFVPPSTSRDIHIAGRMFGDGIYLSRSASKSLGYSIGHWGGDKSVSAFMFLTHTAMGYECRAQAGESCTTVTRRAHRPDVSGKSYDSIEVRPGTGGVRNHEAIVWDTTQVKLSYLVEF